MGTDFYVGPAEIGQGVMVLNYPSQAGLPPAFLLFHPSIRRAELPHLDTPLQLQPYSDTGVGREVDFSLQTA